MLIMIHYIPPFGALYAKEAVSRTRVSTNIFNDSTIPLGNEWFTKLHASFFAQHQSMRRPLGKSFREA